jgi:hypothetical protein
MGSGLGPKKLGDVSAALACHAARLVKLSQPVFAVLAA